MYRETTRDIQVDVEPKFIAAESRPEDSYYFFSYTIQIKNLGAVAVKLLTRHWIIIDGSGASHEVRGDGVVGETPVIEPGQCFEYTSFCPLPTKTGNMRGSYRLTENVDAPSAAFDVRIPLFFLRNAETLH